MMNRPVGSKPTMMSDSRNQTSILTTSPSLSLASPVPLASFVHVNPPPTVSITPRDIPNEHDAVIPVNLTEKLLGDVAVAATVTAFAAPFLTVVDKALVQRSTGSHTIMSSAAQSMGSMLRHPIAYLKSPTYLWMWATYAATYTAANMLRTLTEHQEQCTSSKAQSVSSSTTTSTPSTAATTLFVGTTLVNSGVSLIKDRAYAKMFGNKTTATVPRISYGLWMARDFTVIGSSFILPTHVAKLLQDQTGMHQENALRVAQVGTPVVAQLIAGPLHFLGLDCFNRNLNHMSATSSRILERCRFLTNGFAEVVMARMVRIIPGYSIAGVLNTQLRGDWRAWLLERQQQQHVRRNVTSRPKDDDTIVTLMNNKLAPRMTTKSAAA